MDTKYCIFFLLLSYSKELDKQKIKSFKRKKYAPKLKEKMTIWYNANKVKSSVDIFSLSLIFIMLFIAYFGIFIYIKELHKKMQT